MNPILIDYIKRFQKPATHTNDSNNSNPEVDSKFFTSYSLSEHYSKLPYLYNIENFCLRLHKALKQNQKVCIYSDYDTDAITATGVMYWGLVELGFKSEQISYYAPDRFIEGYGINLEAIKKLAEENDLIISVDCGINSVEEAKYLLSHSCDLIITDHHLLVGSVPKSIAVCNPRLSDYYNQNDQVNQKTPAIDSGLLKEFPETSLWLEAVEHSSKNYMSHSVTGVGVAWFVLVWYKYFLQALETNLETN